MKKVVIFCFFVVSVAYIYAQKSSIVVDSQKVKIASLDHKKIKTNIPLTKAQADSAYIRGDYVSAIAIYEEILANKGESADIYYNLGNSYYKNNNISKSLLNLERALLLDPGDSDIRFNLDLVRSKTVDKVAFVNEVFFVTWFHSIRNWMSADQWGKVAIASFFVFTISVSLYIFGKKIGFKKIGFIVAIFAFIIVILANTFAYFQKKSLLDRRNAIIMVPSVTVKSTPTEGGTDLFILHEGHKINIKDSYMRDWVEIRLEDGNVGWVPASVIEII